MLLYIQRPWGYLWTKGGLMNNIQTLLQNYQVKPVNKNIHSEIHLLADEISTYFNEKRLFGMYLGIIKRISVQQARSLFKQLQETKGRTAGRLFVYLSKRVVDKVK